MFAWPTVRVDLIVSSFLIQILPLQEQKYPVLSLYNKNLRGCIFKDRL